MIVINEKQLEVFNNASFQQFIQRMVCHFTSILPSLETSQETDKLESFIVTAIDVAENYAIDIETDLEKFIELALVLGPDFPEKHMWASDILNDDSLLGEEKVQMLVEHKAQLQTLESSV